MHQDIKLYKYEQLQKLLYNLSLYNLLIYPYLSYWYICEPTSHFSSVQLSNAIAIPPAPLIINLFNTLQVQLHSSLIFVSCLHLGSTCTSFDLTQLEDNVHLCLLVIVLQRLVKSWRIDKCPLVCLSCLTIHAPIDRSVMERSIYVQHSPYKEM